MPCNWTFWNFASKRSKMWTSQAQEKLKVKVFKFISKFETNSQILSDSTNLRREVAYPNHYWIEWLWRTPEEGKLECQWRETARIPGLKEMKTKLFHCFKSNFCFNILLYSCVVLYGYYMRGQLRVNGKYTRIWNLGRKDVANDGLQDNYLGHFFMHHTQHSRLYLKILFGSYIICTIILNSKSDHLCLVLLQVPKCFVPVQIFWASLIIWLHLVPLQQLLCWHKNQF